NHFPMYNKFRTPAMILTLANLCVAFVAGLALYELLSGKPDKSALLKRLKFSLVITLGILLAAGILGSFLFDFKAEADARLAESGWPLSALRADRASMLRADALRSIVLVALAGALLWGLAESKLKTNFFIAGMGVLLLFDGWQISKRYLNNDDFLTKTEIESYYRPTKANLEILKDTDLSYRVLNLTTSTFNDALTSYFHKSIGGYHAAKIRRYQDLIEKQIRANIERLSKGFTNEHIPVLNMLNMRYIIAKEDRPIRNPNAMGNAWFVPNYRAVKGAVQEMEALSDFNPAREAIVDSQFENYLQGLPQHDTAGGTLVLTAYAPDALAYKAAAAQESLAVFSEIYYDGTKGWKAYLDGTPVEHIRVNYVLRAMRVPAGEHTIEFKFEPESYYTGEKISLACSSVLLLWVAGMLVVELRKKKK
ncbi:MAG TPA: hypothetical protein VNJ07_12795, partial [Chitinophagales bacterium]|nr:hypothetical protein [Chitinophagales bacterium]